MQYTVDSSIGLGHACLHVPGRERERGGWGGSGGGKEGEVVTTESVQYRLQ